MNNKAMKSIIFSVLAVLWIGGAVGASVYSTHIAQVKEQEQWQRQCDGVNVKEKCTGDDGVKYSKYVFHAAVKEETEVVHHEKVPAVTHTVYHPAEWGTRSVRRCQRTTISYKNGTCAQSQCWDGEYSGSSGRGTCSYHGGVMRRGPFYYYENETYLKKGAWTETVVDVPEKPAYDETVVIVAARDAYYEKIKYEEA